MPPKPFAPPIYQPPKPVGRPRKGAHPPVFRDNTGTAAAQNGMKRGDSEGTVVQQTSVLPRLLDLNGAAGYLSVSTWTVREWASRGWLPRVRFLLPNGHEVRRMLFDVKDLDDMVERAKDGQP